MWGTRALLQTQLDNTTPIHIHWKLLTSPIPEGRDVHPSCCKREGTPYFPLKPTAEMYWKNQMKRVSHQTSWYPIVCWTALDPWVCSKVHVALPHSLFVEGRAELAVSHAPVTAFMAFYLVEQLGAVSSYATLHMDSWLSLTPVSCSPKTGGGDLRFPYLLRRLKSDRYILLSYYPGPWE